MIRLRGLLQDAGYSVVLIDLQAYASDRAPYHEFLQWFSLRICGQLDRFLEVPQDNQKDDLESWLQSNLPNMGSIALLLDEVAAVPREHRLRFFSQLRAFYGSRALDESGVAGRTVIMFAGTFRPERLIDSGNSPFNVSVDIRPEDLSLQQTVDLAQHVDPTLAAWATRVHELVQGQPYLTQKFLSAVHVGSTEAERDALWDQVVRSAREGRDDRHLSSIFQHVLADPSLKAIVSSLSSGQPVHASPADVDHTFLDVLGVCRSKDGLLVMRNPLYSEVASTMPQLVSEVTAASVQPPSLMVMREGSDFEKVSDDVLREMVLDLYASGINSYMAGDYRVSLASFGAALEALLIDFLERLGSTDRADAIQQLEPAKRPDRPGRPSRWSFEQIIEVSHRSPGLDDAQKSLAHQVRDWRNLIHPAKARAEYQTQSQLEPEARMAVAVVDKVLNSL